MANDPTCLVDRVFSKKTSLQQVRLEACLLLMNGGYRKSIRCSLSLGYFTE